MLATLVVRMPPVGPVSIVCPRVPRCWNTPGLGTPRACGSATRPVPADASAAARGIVMPVRPFQYLEQAPAGPGAHHRPRRTWSETAQAAQTLGRAASLAVSRPLSPSDTILKAHAVCPKDGAARLDKLCDRFPLRPRHVVWPKLWKDRHRRVTQRSHQVTARVFVRAAQPGAPSGCAACHVPALVLSWKPTMSAACDVLYLRLRNRPPSSTVSIYRYWTRTHHRGPLVTTSCHGRRRRVHHGRRAARPPAAAAVAVTARAASAAACRGQCSSRPSPIPRT